MARLIALQAGHCTHPACMALQGAGWRSRCFPSRAYLIETQRGWVLWDTGYADRLLHWMNQGVYRLYGWTTPVQLPPSQTIRVQLHQRGLSPRDVHTVVVSHFHADHYAGLDDFPHSRVLCSEAAWRSVGSLRGLSAVRHAFIPELIPSNLESRLVFVEQRPVCPLPSSLSPYVTAWDVLETGELLVVPLPGHARGHLGAFVQTDSGWVLLASDAAWDPQSYRALTPPSRLSYLVQDSRRDHLATLRQLHALHEGGQARILLTHEPAEEGSP
jgi:glyoxylase-like metal-dependent hydrolase (beta-lactamase superfamily II)